MKVSVNISETIIKETAALYGCEVGEAKRIITETLELYNDADRIADVLSDNGYSPTE